jgi:hypothetical protein
MRKPNRLLSTTVLVITVVMLCLTSGCNNEQVGMEADTTAIKEVLNQYAVAVNGDGSIIL